MQQQGGNIFAMIHSHSSTQVAAHSPMLHGPIYLVTPMVSLSFLEKGIFLQGCYISISHCIPCMRQPFPLCDLVTATSALQGSRD